MRKPKKLPEFKTEAEERAFWESHDSSDYVDWSQAKQVTKASIFPSNQSTRAIDASLFKPTAQRLKAISDQGYDRLTEATDEQLGDFKE